MKRGLNRCINCGFALDSFGAATIGIPCDEHRGLRIKRGLRVSMQMSPVATGIPGKAAELTLWGTVRGIEADGTIRVRWDGALEDSWATVEDLT